MVVCEPVLHDILSEYLSLLCALQRSQLFFMEFGNEFVLESVQIPNALEDVLVFTLEIGV